MEYPSARSDVGSLVSLVVKMSNVRSTSVSTAIVDIFYPAYAEETREHFYLLPDCGVTSSITVCMIYISLLAIFFLLLSYPSFSLICTLFPTYY